MARGPEGRKVYAFGDIHGCDDLLTALLDSILVQPGRQPPLLVFLGDYVDRGSDSRNVIEILIDLQSGYPDARFLCGNHEEAMLRFLGDAAQGPAWFEFGGRETLLSYGVAPPRERSAEACAITQAALLAALPESHLNFLSSLEDWVELGDFFFVHAGVRPDVDLGEQSRRDLLWIREPFLNDDRRLSKIIVHGHTPAEAPHADHRRVGVDTGAYATGVLTALELDGERQSFIQARRSGSDIAIAWLEVLAD